jgi:hypothetical protein
MSKGEIKLCTLFCGFTLTCIGVGIMAFFSYYQLHASEVISISYKEMLCSCRSNCNVYKTNGCSHFCDNGFNHYNKRQTFNCLSMSVMTTVKDIAGNKTCEFKDIERGFYYPSLHAKWTDPEYINYYKSYNFGDIIKVYYNKETNDCITTLRYNTDFAAGIICLAVGCFLLFVYSCYKYNKVMKKRLQVVHFVPNIEHIVDIKPTTNNTNTDEVKQ